MAEVMLGATSDLAGKTVVESRFRTEHRLTVIGLRRGSAAMEGNLLNEKLKVGDTLLVIGPWKHIRELQTDAAHLVVLNLPAELDEVLPASGKAPQAVACLLLMVGLMISGIVPNVQAALIACLLMGALRCIDFEQRLSLDPLEEPGPHRRHAALLPRAAAHRRRGHGRRRADRGDRRRGNLRGAREPLPHHRHARPVHLEHRHGRADGSGRARHRQGHERVALSVRHDRRAGRLDRVHDADLVAGEHAGRRSGQLQVRRLREDRRAVQPGR